MSDPKRKLLSREDDDVYLFNLTVTELKIIITPNREAPAIPVSSSTPGV